MTTTMLHPVGSRPPVVYWRRRLVLFGSLVLVIVLLVLTVRTLLSPGGDGDAAASGGQQRSTAPATADTPSTVDAPSTADAPSTERQTTHAAPPPPPPCTAAQLSVSAAVGKNVYAVGEQPVVMLQVTNDGDRKCVANLADSQVVLLVYNGVSRVWGSHDCTVHSGVTKRTLPVGKPVRVSVVWSGLSSRPDCDGVRQRVGAGTYTVYAELSGHRGKAAHLRIS